MDTDFVNKYIQKQNQLITELTSKNLMVEVKLQLLEERYNDLAAQHQSLVESVERARQAAEERAAVEAAEREAQSRAKKKQPPAIEQPSVTDFVEEEQITESQF